MKMFGARHRASLDVIAALILLCGQILAQGQTEKQVQRPMPASSCSRANALELIRQQIDVTKTFDNTVQRITVLIRAADLLWPYQQDKARAAFTESFELAKQNFREAGDDPRSEGKFSTASVPDQRYTVINAIAKRDLAWARRLTDQMLEDQRREAEEKATKDAKDTDQGNRTAEKLLIMASSLLASDQSAALSFAASSLRYPATFYLPLFFYKLAPINRSAADQFYQEALAAYANAPMDRFLYLSSYPFGNNREAGEMPGYTIYQVPAGFEPSPALQRLFVQNLLRRAQQPGEDSADPTRRGISEAGQMWLALTRLEGQIQQSLPDLAPAVEQAKGSLYTQLAPESRRDLDRVISNQNAPKKTFDEQVEAAEKNPNVDRRDQLLAFAIVGASAKESLDHVLSVVDKISDSSVRAQLLNWIYFNRAESAMKDQKLDEARKLAAKVEELDNRAYLYSRIAEESLKQNPDQIQARELLDEVVAAASKAPATLVTARALLGVAYLYTRFDLNRAIGVMAEAVKCINRLEAPDFSRQFVMRKIEGKTFGSYAAFQTPGFSPENAFREVGRLDFDGTLYLTSNFTDKSLRALTTLALVEECLKNGTPEKPDKAKPKRKP